MGVGTSGWRLARAVATSGTRPGDAFRAVPRPALEPVYGPRDHSDLDADLARFLPPGHTHDTARHVTDHILGSSPRGGRGC